MFDLLLTFATLGLGAHVVGVDGRSARHVPDQQGPIQSRQTFHETSIFRPVDDIVTVNARHGARASPPEFHLYDNFGKDTPMPGIATFAHLNWTNCFVPESNYKFDIGITGMPFDLGVSYRPGQRSGPAAARTVAQRMAPFISYRY